MCGWRKKWRLFQTKRGWTLRVNQLADRDDPPIWFWYRLRTLIAGFGDSLRWACTTWQQSLNCRWVMCSCLSLLLVDIIPLCCISAALRLGRLPEMVLPLLQVERPWRRAAEGEKSTHRFLTLGDEGWRWRSIWRTCYEKRLINDVFCTTGAWFLSLWWPRFAPIPSLQQMARW